VEQWVDGKLAARAIANIHRGDLTDAGIGDGLYGWRMPVALDPAKAGVQRVEVRVADWGVVPNGTFDLTHATVRGPVPNKAGPLGLFDVKMDGWYNTAAQELAPGFPVSEVDLVVDVGAGDGGMATFCAQLGARAILVDTDAARVAQAVERVRIEVDGRIEGRVADGAALPVPDGAASRVICTEVLEHVDDPAAVMAELVRIGQPGALYLLSVPGEASERLQQKVAPAHYFEKPNHIRIFQADEFERLVVNAGLTIERRIEYGFYWAMWWTFFWQAGIELGEESHPLLDAWNRTWAELLNCPDGARTKRAFDGLMPKNFVLIARKPL
jgi:SAM-dependent methyltransferase